MRPTLPLLIGTLLLALRASAGSIVGTVHAEGKLGTESDALCGKYDSREFRFVERVNYAAMQDFVVYIDGPVATNAPPPTKPVEVVTRRVAQKGALFDPHVLPIMVGTTVEWPNNDDILHNVFSFSEAKSFDLGLYKSPEIKRVTFDQPGRVDVFCSIHTRMSCIVLVLQNPYFDSTRKGAYALRNVPAGHYRLKAWHERLPSAIKEITVPETGQIKVDFTLGINHLPAS